MFSFKIVLSCFTGARTTTYVMANSRESARRIAENRVNTQSQNGWRAIEISAEYPPDGYQDAWK